MIVRFTRRFAVPLLVLSALGLAGCSGSSGDDLPREAVSGTVTLDGAPLPSGSISFSPDGGGPGGGGGTITDGRFSIAREVGLPPGNYKVAINSAKKREDQTKPAQAGGGKSVAVAKELIPTKYNARSQLKVEIKKGGGNDLKLELESK